MAKMIRVNRVICDNDKHKHGSVDSSRVVNFIVNSIIIAELAPRKIRDELD